MNNLVIVESPTKARTLARFLGKDYRIEASMGHIRDLPKAEMGVDTEHDFEPKYVIPRDKKKKVNELKKMAEGVKNIWLASDPDREGEAIAWHIREIITGDKPKKGTKSTEHEIKRVVFHEITESAIKDAFLHPRELDIQLVDAQQARRVLDRLVGYKLSPLLWKKVKRGLSAGRVQSVALRLIVERDREIDAFKPVEYWSIEVQVAKTSHEKFIIELIEKDGKKVEIKNSQEAEAIVDDLKKAAYQVSKVNKKEVRRYPSAPFTTSTLQQASGNKLGMSAKKTMMIAQNLYEHGIITYMRTDSVNLSTEAVEGARNFINSQYGSEYLPAMKRIYKAKSKNAQEAHEAIRPTNMTLIADKLNGDQYTRDHKRLYDLIWKRAVASQMADAVLDQTTVEVTAKPSAKNSSDQAESYNLRTTGSILKFDGWLKIYGVKQIVEEETEKSDEEEKKQVLPDVSEGEDLIQKEVLPAQHFTQPPPRFTEASLVKKLEELGIGRPSTYAPIISTIQDRFYVEREERRFKATPLGMAVNDFLMKYFSEVFDYEFTASMEDRLDEVSRGERQWKTTIADFFRPFEKKIEATGESAERVALEIEKVDKQCPDCGKDLLVRTGKFGKFLACSGFPDCKHTEPIVEQIDAKCPQDGGDVMVRKTKKGKTFYGCKNWPKCTYASWTKPVNKEVATETSPKS
jgi:DNA topoisomerase-1